ncbi:MAG: hypothetical protein K8T25_12290 [Planctomycetia bacterium]|nr:hypothetical protein [Planctomycetia bacterium]
MDDTAASTTVIVFRLTHIHRVDRKRGSVVFATTEPRGSLSFSAPAAINMTVDPRLDSRFVVAILKTDGAASYLELNGVRVPGQQAGGRSGADFVLGTSAPPPPGSNNYPTGIAELMIYDRALSDIETRQIAQYLQRRYGIAAGQ